MNYLKMTEEANWVPRPEDGVVAESVQVCAGGGDNHSFCSWEPEEEWVLFLKLAIQITQVDF